MLRVNFVRLSAVYFMPFWLAFGALYDAKNMYLDCKSFADVLPLCLFATMFFLLATLRILRTTRDILSDTGGQKSFDCSIMSAYIGFVTGLVYAYGGESVRFVLKIVSSLLDGVFWITVIVFVSFLFILNDI